MTPPIDIPEKLRGDFGLEVTMLVGRDGKMVPLQLKQGQDVFQLEDSQDVQFRIKVARKAYVGVWTVETGGAIRQLFPNDWEPDHAFRAGEERTVPQDGVSTTKSKGMDLLWVVASVTPWEPLQGERDGFFLLFKQEHHRAAWERTRRGMELKRKPFSEKVLKYYVAPRP
jgi:hypothetical protein